jgi:hypothetical protein
METSPDEAVAMLESLVALYGPTASDAKADEQISAIVALAKRRLPSLRNDLDKMRERRLTSLRERMDVAGQLSPSDSEEAIRMYQAIIDLHGKDKWAAEIVATARDKLAKLNP